MDRNKSVNSQSVRLEKIRKQAVFSVTVGFVMLVLMLIFTTALKSVQNSELEVTMALNQYRLGSKALTYAVQSYAVTGNKQYYDDYMRELNTDKNRNKALEILKANDIKDYEWEKLNDISNLSNGLVPLEEQAMLKVEKGDLVSAQNSVFGEEYRNTIGQINDLTDTMITEIQERIEKQKNFFSLIQLVVEVLCILSMGYLILQFIKTINFSHKELLEPIEKVSEQIILVSKGDFSHELDLKEDDSEVGEMVSAINFMKKNIRSIVKEISDVLENMGNGNYRVDIKQEYVGEFIKIKDSFFVIGEKMKEMITTLKEAAAQINSGSEQLACAAEDLAEGSTNQANQVSNLVTVIGDMTENIQKNAIEAGESVKIASEAGKTLKDGNIKMNELKEAIKEISNCSEQIGTIIADIEDIASQTNLLSLNAAIEAARAGDAGKGFSVVAEQVKKLAEESQEAAGRTRKFIETTILAVNKGISITEETAKSINDVMYGAGLATEKMGEIFSVLEKEVSSMQEINSRITEVSSIVDNNSATSEETAAVSEQQSAQVETMVQFIDRFKI